MAGRWGTPPGEGTPVSGQGGPVAAGVVTVGAGTVGRVAAFGWWWVLMATATPAPAAATTAAEARATQSLKWSRRDQGVLACFPRARFGARWEGVVVSAMRRGYRPDPRCGRDPSPFASVARHVRAARVATVGPARRCGRRRRGVTVGDAGRCGGARRRPGQAVR